MERKGPFVLAGILFLVGITVGQDDAVRTKASPPIASGAVLSPLRPAKKPESSASLEQKKQALASYSRLPLSFEPNQGQAADPVKYLARGAGYSLLLTGKESVLVLQQQRSAEGHDMQGRRPQAENAGRAVLRLGFQNANPTTTLTGEDELPGKSNYFIGNDPQKWRTGVPNYARVRYHDVYPGIDVLYYGNQSRLEYDFIVAPGVRPQQIGLSIEGAEKLEIDHPTGDLVMQLKGGIVRLRKPLVYQETKGARREVAAAYVLENGQVTFRIADYDHGLPLVIDPVLTFSTYLGGSADELFTSPYFGSGLINIGIGLDTSNPPNVYVTGETLSANFPATAGAYDTGCGTDVPPTCNSTAPGGPFGDVFISEFSPSGVMLASTFLGGSDEDIPGYAGYSGGLAVDATGVYVAGITFSSDFPTMNALHSTNSCPGCGDGFVTKLQPALDKLIFSTYVSGNGTASAGSLAVDSGQNIYVTGSAVTGFPTTAGAFQQTCPPGSNCLRGFVMKLNSSGGGPIYSTLIGGNGGSNSVGSDNVLSIALDSANPPNAYLSGTTLSADFPTNTTLQPTPPGGGVAVSTNGGSSWATHFTGLTTLQFFSVAFNPGPPSTLLAGGANGIYLSSDGGNTWTLKLGTTVQVSGIAFDPVNASNVYAVTRGQGVFLSGDGGSTWNPSANTNLTNKNIFALAVDPANNIYVGTNAGVFKSIDGQNWTPQSSGITDLHIRSLAIDPTTPSTIYAGTATSLFQSVNSAGSWVQTNAGLMTSNGSTVTVNALAITPGATSTLYAGTTAGVFKSTNSGSSWVAMNSGMNTPDGSARSVSSLVIDPLRPQNVYAGTTSNGVYASTNAAVSWTPTNNSGLTLVVGALAIVSTSIANPPTLYAATRPNIGFLAKLDPNGASLLASTFWGGNGTSVPSAIAANSSGVYVAGYTTSTNFFTKSPLPGQSILNGAVNAVVSKLNTSLSSYSYSTYLGGSGSDYAFGVAVDGSGNAWVTGQTTSQDFPLANAVWLNSPSHGSNGTEAFVTQLNSAGSGLVFSTYLGGKNGGNGNPNTTGIGIKVDAAGDAYVMGYTNTNDFPTANASQPALGGGYDAFVTEIGSVATQTDLSICFLDPNTGQCTTAPPPAVVAGADFVFNIQVSNNSPATPATGVVVGGRGGNVNGVACSIVPAGAGVCAPDNSALVIPNGGFANLGTMAPGAKVQIIITLRAEQAGTSPVEVDVRENESDANPADNSASTTLTILPGADLAVSLNQSPSTVPGVPANVTYNAVVNNLGPSNATSVTAVISFSPAAAVTFGAITVPANCSAPNAANGTVTVTCSSIAAGGSLQLSIPTTLSSLPVTATVVVSPSPEADPDPTNNSQSLTTVLNAGAGVNNAELNGHYTFVVRGFDINGLPIAIGASFAADGVVNPGNITGGVLDINSAATGYSTLTINPGSFANQTGSFYSIGPDNRGQLTLNTSDGVTRTFDFDVGLISSGVASMGYIISRQNNSSAPASLSTGLLGYWQFNGNGNDSSGRGNTVNLNGTAGFGSGLLGQGLSLNGAQGTNAAMTTNHTAFDFGSGDFTIQVWAKLNTSAEQTLLEKFSGANGPGWSLTTAVPGAGNVQFYTQGGPILNSPTAISTGVWQQIIVQRSGSAWNLFLNGNTGTPAATATLSAPINPSTNPLLFGARNSGDGRNLTLNGVEDEVAIWNRALSAAEISQLWNNGAGLAFGRTGSAISGVFKKQDPAAFALPALDGDWAFLDEGTSNRGRFVSAGRFTLSGGSINPTNQACGASPSASCVDINDNGSFDNGTVTPQTFTGSFGTLDTTNGRAPLTTTSGGPNPTPTNNAVYIVSASEVLFMGVDAIATNPITGGSALRQDTTTFCPTTGNCAFTNNALNGNAVIYDQGNSSTVAGASKVEVGALTFAPGIPTGTVSGGLDANDGGNIRTPSDDIVSANYSVASNGRVTITGGGGHNPFLYMVSNNQAFLVGSDSSVLAGAGEPQIGPIMFTSAFRSAGTQWPAVSGTQVFEQVQAVTATSNTTEDVTNNVVDSNSISAGLHENVLLPSFVVNDLDPVTGRFSFTDGGTGGSPRVAYFVNSNRRITINADPTVTAPFIIISDAQNSGTGPGTQPDLTVGIATNPGAYLGGTITYTVTVINANSTAATGVVLDTAFSPSLTVNSVTPSQGACAAGLPATLGSFSCSLGTVTQGMPVTVIVVAAAPAGGNTCGSSALGCITAGATVTEIEVDANPADNSTSVTTPLLAAAADLAVFMTDSPHPPVVSNPYTYTITVTDLGPSPATGVVLTDVLPANVSFSSLTGTGCASNSGTITCNIGGLAAGGTFTATVTVVPTTASVVNTANVSGTSPDPDPANNSYTVSSTASENLLVTDFDNDAVRIISLVNGSAVTTPIRPGRSPAGVAVSPNRRLAFVGDHNSNYTSVVDTSIQREIARIHNLQTEWDLAFTPDGTKVVVPNVNTNELAVVDAATFQVLAHVPFDGALGTAANGDYLGSVVVAGNKAFANINGSTSALPVLALDLTQFQVSPVSGTAAGFGLFAGGIAATPDQSQVLAVRLVPNALFIIDAASATIIQNIALPFTPLGIATVPHPTSPANNFAFLAHTSASGVTVSAVDLRTGSPTYGQVLPGTDVVLSTITSLWKMTSNADGSRLAVIAPSSGSGDNLAVLDTTPVRGCSNTPAACQPPTILFHQRIGDTQSELTGATIGFVETAPVATAPVVSGPLSPASVVNNAGTTVQFTGSNLGADVMVRIGTHDPVAASQVSGSVYQVTVPTDVGAGPTDVIVTFRNGAGPVEAQDQSTLLPNALTITNPAAYHPVNQAAVTDTGGDQVGLLNLKSEFLTQFPLPFGDRPLSVAISADGVRAYTTSFAPGNVDFFRLDTLTQEQPSLALLGPYGTNGGNIFGQNDAIVATVNPATGNPVMAVLSTLVSGTGTDDQVSILDANPASPTFKTVINSFTAGITNGSATGGIGSTPDGKFLYANDSVGDIIVFNLSTGTVGKTILSTATLGVRAFQSKVYVTLDGNSLLLETNAGGIAVFDISGANRTNPQPVTTITGTQAGFASVFLNSYQVVGTTLFAYDSFDGVVQVFNFDRTGNNFSQIASFAVPGETGRLDADLAVTPDGSLIYVVLEGQDQVLVLSTSAMPTTANPSSNPVVTRLAAGVNPISVAVSSVTAAEPDLSVGITTNPTNNVLAGGAINYTLTVSNARSTAATGAVLTTTFSPSLTVNSVTPSQGSCNATGLPATVGSFICNLGTVSQGTPVTVTIAAVAPASGNITASALVTENEPDFNPADNSATAITTVVAQGTTSCTGNFTYWLGGNGNWSNGLMWSTGVVPNSPSVNVCIDNGTPGASQVTLDINASVGTLTIDSDDSVIISNGMVLAIAGSISNTGQILLNASANPTFLQIAAGQNVTLTGGGTVTMATGNAIINQGSGGGSTLTNVNNTIQGAGQIGNNGLALVNQSGGIINANAAGATLVVNAPAVTNAGLLEATGGGALQVSQLGSGSGAPTVNNAGGTIAANGSNSAVQIAGGATIQGGTLNTLNGGVLGTPAGTSATLDGSTHGTLTNAGTYTAATGSTTVLVGTITNTNTGAFLINAAANPTFLQIAAGQNVTLTGGGTVTMATGNAIINQGSGGGSTLTNVNNTIQGAGQIGNNGLALVNQGTILANAANPLVINPAAFTNSGTMQVNSGSSLNVSSGNSLMTNTGNVVVNSGGTINLAAGLNYTQTAGSTRVDGALTGGVLNINAGTLLGSGGTITASANLAGVLSPGDLASTAGMLTINGAYSQTGAYNVDIGGSLPGQYDQVNVTGTVALGGTLNVNSINGFSPAVGNSFTIVTASSVSGTFATVNLPTLSSGIWQVTYNATSVVLAVTSSNPVPEISTISPTSATAGSGGFTLTVNGASGPLTGNMTVQATDVIYAAGSQNSLAAGANGTVPGAISLPSQASSVSFSSVRGSLTSGCGSPLGCITVNSGGNLNDPDGVGAAVSTSSTTGSGSFSGMTGPGAGYLVGVFVAAGGPSGTAPPALDFTSSGIGTSFTTLSPLLNQVFYIGDGLTGDGTGTTQTFNVPAGATQLYLGISDAPFYNGTPGSYGDNAGAYSVAYTVADASSTGFINGSTVNFNGIPATTTFVSAVQLTAAIPASDIANPGTFNVTVTNPAPGGGTSNAVTFTVNPAPVIAPAISKAFGGAASLPLNGSTALTFNLTNPNTTTLTAVGFNDTLPPGLVVATPNGLTGGCGGGPITAIQGTNTISLSGATLPASPNGVCSFSVNVTGTSAGIKNNTTGPVTSKESGAGGTASASIDVAAPPTINKGFGASAIPLNGTTTLAFTLTNPAANAIPLTGIAFTDTLPAGLVVATPSALSGSCGSGIVTAAAGSSSISLSAGTLAINGSCNFSVNVTGIGIGNQVNTTSNVTSSEGGTGNAATASITILTPPDLTISKTHSGNFTAGANGVYTVTVTNLGGAATTGTITVTDTLPTGLSFVSGSAGWSCSANGQVVTCTNPGPIAGNNGTSILTLTVSVANDAPCTVTNTATVSGGGELNTDNDSVDDITNIGDFCVYVAVVQPANGSGTTVTYDVIITNQSSSDASGLDLNDQLTGNASFASVSSETMTCPASSPLPNPLDCTMTTLPANSSAAATIAVKLTEAGWDGNNISITLKNPPLILAHNAAAIQRPPAGGSTVTGSDVAVQPADSTTGASPAILTYATVTRGGTTTLASAASGPAPPSGFRTGTPSVFYNLATTAGYSGMIGVVLGFNGANFHHADKVGLFHYENGAWVNRTVAVSTAGGYAAALAGSLSPFALFEPVNQPPVATPGPALTTTATSAQGAKVTLNGSASSDPDGDPLTYRWTGPFPEGNGVVTGVNQTVTMPLGANQVMLVVNDGEVNSAPASQTITVADFSMAAAAVGSTTTVAGGSVNFSITASPQFGPFPAAVALACTGLPQGAQCNFSSATVNAGGPAAALTIITAPRTMGLVAPVHHGNRAPLYALWMPLPAIMLMGLGAHRRGRKHTARLMLLLLLGMMLLLVSCGGGSMGVTQQQQNGTPAGTFTITVTGTANGGLQHTTTASFTVQ